jgi:acetylornithine deacetylase
MTIMTPYELMEKLISFPTVSRDPNTDLIDWVESYLAAHGIVSHRHWRDEARTHCALFAHVGPEIEGGVVLSGHTDVVPVDGQPWSSDPVHGDGAGREVFWARDLRYEGL